MTHRNKSFRVLRVGKRGEIYTTSDIRAEVGIKKGGFVIAYVDGNKLVIRPLEPLEERIRKHILKLTPDDVEKLSEEVQEKAGMPGWA